MKPDDYRIGRRKDFRADLREETKRLRLEEGLTQEQIAERIGRSRGLVGRYLREQGITAKRVSPSKQRQDRMRLVRYLYDGVSEDRVHQIVDDYEAYLDTLEG